MKHYRPGTFDVCDQPATIVLFADGGGLCRDCFRECIQHGWDSDGAKRDRLSREEWDEFVEIQIQALDDRLLNHEAEIRRAELRAKLCDLSGAENAIAGRLIRSAFGESTQESA